MHPAVSRPLAKLSVARLWRTVSGGLLRGLLALGLLISATASLRSEYVAIYNGPSDAQWRTGDELWVVNTRDLNPGDAFLPTVSQWSPDRQQAKCEGGWQQTCLESLLHAPPKLTVIYVHGNRMTFEESLLSGWDLYVGLVRDNRLPPVRLVIWSWPSEPVHGILRDVRCKAVRADDEAHFLARFLESLRPDIDAALIGYSFGARMIVRAIHLMENVPPPQDYGQVPSALSSGGFGAPFLSHRGQDTREFAGFVKTLPQIGRPGPRTISIVLIAAALDSQALALHRPYSDIVNRVDQALVLFNSCDPILKHYGWLEKSHTVYAMGYIGVGGPLVRENIVWEFDVAHLVGRTHYLSRYLENDTIIKMVRRYVVPASSLAQ